MKRYFVHLLTSFKHHTGLTLVTMIVLTASFFVSGSLMIVGQNLDRVLTLWGESLQMSVYLKEGTSKEQAEVIQAKLKSDRRIAKANYINRTEALANFQEQMASYAPDLLNDAQLLKFIPESLQIQISQSVSSALQLKTLQDLASELGTDPFVESVSYGQDWVKTYSSVVGAVSKAGVWVITLILAAAGFVISNSVSSSIHQRKNEIEVLELVGASKWMIRGPYLFEGFFLGALAGGFSLLVLAVSFEAIRNFLEVELAFLQLSHHLHFFGVSQNILFILGAASVGLLSSAFSLRKLNDGWSASRAGQEA
ncbi:MAG: cell division protein FtsX [Bdellovibrio sp.]